MAKFEDEPGDITEPVQYIPPPPWDDANQDETTDATQANVPPIPGGGGPPPGGGEEPPSERPSPYGPVYPGERPYPEHAPVPPPRYNPNDWWLSESMLQQKRIPVINPGPLPSPYAWWPQQPGIPESMFQQGKGWTPTPQFQETVNLTPGGYAETITSPSNWMIPQPPRLQGPQMPPPRYGGGGGYGGGYGGYGGQNIPEWLRILANALRYGGYVRI